MIFSQISEHLPSYVWAHTKHKKQFAILSQNNDNLKTKEGMHDY